MDTSFSHLPDHHLIDEISSDSTIQTEIENLGVSSLTSPFAKKNYPCFVSEYDRILAQVSRTNIKDIIESGKEPVSFETAGAREKIFFNPSSINCAIVTCGGLCPGINDVIRSVVLTLTYGYGVKSIFGIKYGLRGFIPEYNHPEITLTPDVVSRIHELGGTILASSRGPQSTDTIVDTLDKMKLSVLFLVGGDGTFRAAAKIAAKVKERKLQIAVVAIPKTIDNDIYLVPKTFGFGTAVEMACQAIKCSHTEATGAPNGIGLVKVMGRNSGFIAAAAANASREVNFCLIPESDFDLDGSHGLLNVLKERLKKRNHAVIVVAEGAGQRYVTTKENEKDPSGNLKLGDIGLFLKNKIAQYFKQHNTETFIRYIDPSYIIRSVPANVEDSLYCANLGQNAVHAAMAGKTGLLISQTNNRYVHIPLEAAVSKQKQVNLKSNFWLSVLESTGQPNFKQR
jgi:6-phosphofructokinase 1